MSEVKSASHDARCSESAIIDVSAGAMYISAILVNYNAGDLLGAAVRSLSDCPSVAGVTVIDNASRDGSLERLAGMRGVRVVRNSTNVGFAAACNQGIRMTAADYLLFLNPDCCVIPGALRQLLVQISRDERIGMVGGLLLNPDGSEQIGGRRAIPTPWRSFVQAFGLGSLAGRCPSLFSDFDLRKQPLPSHPIEVEAISGACMLVKRVAIEDVGLWDEGYFLHCEDLDWCMRFRQKGWKIMFAPDAKIIHHKGTCSKSRPIFVEWHKHKGMMRFYRKFFRHEYPGVLMWLVAAGVWLRFAVLATYYGMRHLVRRLGLARG